MTMEVPIITVYFGLNYTTGDFFTLDDPIKGVLDGTTYVLAGDVGVNVGVNAVSLSVRRGRSRELDEFEAGEATVILENFDRIYDGLNAAGAFFNELVPGKRVTITMQGRSIFDGTVEDWDVDWPVDAAPTATLKAVDVLGTLARKEFDEWVTHEGDTAGPRLHDILNRGEVGVAVTRDFDAGISVLQSDTVTWGSEVLNYAQLVAKSDGGRLYASRTGSLVFRDRHNMFGATVVVEFRDDLTGVEFDGITTQSGSELLFNRVGIDREGGLLKTVEDVAAQDTTGGVRALNRGGLLMNSDDQSLDMASYLLELYKTPTTRISSITVNVSALTPTQKGTVAGLDIGDLIRVVWTPRGVGAAVDQTLTVEGVEHAWSTGRVHWMTMYTSVLVAPTGFILDSDTLGVLDTSALAF